MFEPSYFRNGWTHIILISKKHICKVSPFVRMISLIWDKNGPIGCTRDKRWVPFLDPQNVNFRSGYAYVANFPKNTISIVLTLKYDFWHRNHVAIIIIIIIIIIINIIN